MPDRSRRSDPEPGARIVTRLGQLGFDDTDIAALTSSLSDASDQAFDRGYTEAVRTCIEVLKAAPNRLHALHTVEELWRATRAKQAPEQAPEHERRDA